MKKSKVPTKAAKTKTHKTTKRYASAGAPSEHDFIIIIGGGLVVLMLTIFLFLQ